MSGRGDLDVIKAELQACMREVCERLLPDGRPDGPFWSAHNPHYDEKGKQPALKVRLRGGIVGAWKDWRSGDKGDAIGLVAFCLGTDTRGALAWSRDLLGLERLSRAEQERMRREAEARKKKRHQEDERTRRRKLEAAAALYEARASASPIGPALVPEGTFRLGAGSRAEAHARAYFAARRVPLEGVAALADFCRFSPATEWWRGARYEQRDGRSVKAAAGPLFPAIHSAMRNALGHVTACHLTFLDPARPAKAPVAQAKLMFGEAKAAVIEISRGTSRAPFWSSEADAAPGPVVLAEGIETALSFAVAVPEARVWACGSLSGIGSAPVHLPCVGWVLFARDNNDGNAQAQKQFDQALAELERHGKRIRVEASHVGDDFNDLARGEGEE